MIIDADNFKHLAAIIIAAFGFVSGVLKILYDNKIKKADTFPNLFRAIETIYNELDVGVRHTTCARVLLLKTENGGGVPKIGSHIYSSVVFERTRDDITPTKKQWQRQEVDSVYVKNMVGMLVSENNYVDVPVEDWVGSVVYDVYKSSGIMGSRLYEIARTKKTYYYLSFNFQEKPDNISSKDRATMNGIASNIRRVFAKSKLDF